MENQELIQRLEEIISGLKTGKYSVDTDVRKNKVETDGTSDNTSNIETHEPVIKMMFDSDMKFQGFWINPDFSW